MIENKGLLWKLVALVAVVQSAVLFKIVYDRDRLIKTGREVKLTVQPVDPRDLFRGDYVTLGYDISRIANPALLLPVKAAARGDAVYVTLEPDAAAGWKIKALAMAYPADVAAPDVVLKGRVLWRTPFPPNAPAELALSYGVETYFVPEGTGKDFQDSVRAGKIDALLAVGSDGSAAIKGLTIDGKRHEDPPIL